MALEEYCCFLHKTEGCQYFELSFEELEKQKPHCFEFCEKYTPGYE